MRRLPSPASPPAPSRIAHLGLCGAGCPVKCGCVQIVYAGPFLTFSGASPSLSQLSPHHS